MGFFSKLFGKQEEVKAEETSTANTPLDKQEETKAEEISTSKRPLKDRYAEGSIDPEDIMRNMTGEFGKNANMNAMKLHAERYEQEEAPELNLTPEERIAAIKTAKKQGGNLPTRGVIPPEEDNSISSDSVSIKDRYKKEGVKDSHEGYGDTYKADMGVMRAHAKKYETEGL